MIQTGISFGELHSFRDLDLILGDVEIPPASPKETFVDIPGADGSVDMTEALGEVKFSDRTGAKFTFYMNPAGDLSDSAWEAKKKEISNLLNGWRGNITLDKDPAYYWQGRCNVSDHSSSKKKRKFVVGARLAPYKLKNALTRVFVPFCGKNLFNNAELPELYGFGCTLSQTATGVRATKTVDAGSFKVIKWLPVKMLLGKTIKMSAVITPVGGLGENLRIGYISADGSRRTAKADIKSTGSKTLTIGDDASEFDYIGLWFYVSGDDGVYVDYDDIQIEIGNEATAFEPYTANDDPQEITLTNARKTICPVIECTGETKLEFSGSEINLSEGAHKVLALQLKEGETPVTVSGTGAVTFAYQEGDL
jgi:hypothetical protein